MKVWTRFSLTRILNARKCPLVFVKQCRVQYCCSVTGVERPIALQKPEDGNIILEESEADSFRKTTGSQINRAASFHLACPSNSDNGGSVPISDHANESDTKFKVGSIISTAYSQTRLLCYRPDSCIRKSSDTSSEACNVQSPLHLDFSKALSNGADSVMMQQKNRFQLNELVILRIRKPSGRQLDFLLQLTVGKNLTISAQVSISVESLLERSVSDSDWELSGYKLSLRRPMLVEYLELLRRNTATTSPKVLYSMFHSLGISRGLHVLEAGSGSGMATLILSSLVGATGHVITLDQSKKSYTSAKRNFDRWVSSYSLSYGVQWPNNVKFIHDDICNYNVEKKFDLVFLDITDLSRASEVSSRLLKNGGVLAFYAPSVSRLVTVDQAVRETGLPLALEGVFEETDTRWHHIPKDAVLILGWPEKREDSTAFLAKFRKVIVSQDSQTTGSSTDDRATTKWDIFATNESAVIRYTDARKTGRLHEKLLTLKPGNKFYNDFGGVAAEDIIGKPVASFLQSSAGFPFYCTRPSVVDLLQSAEGTASTAWNKHIVLSLRLIGLHESHSILVIEDNSHLLMTTLLILLQTVHPSGQIFISQPETVDQSSTFDCEKFHNELRNYLGEGLCQFCPSLENVEFLSVLEKVKKQCDCAYIECADAERYLLVAAQSLRKNGLLAVLCKSVTGVSRVLATVPRLSLEVANIHEHVDRPWVVQPIGIRRKMQKPEVIDGDYICRPKHRLAQKTGYIVILRKL